LVTGEKGADINQKNLDGKTPLHWAVENNNESALGIIRLLLENGADIYQSDFDEFPLLYWAIEKRNESAIEIVHLLIEKEVDINLEVRKRRRLT